MSSFLQGRSLEEQEAANIVANLHGAGSGVMEEDKRGVSGNKRSRDDDNGAMKQLAGKKAAKLSSSIKETTVEDSDEEMDATARVFAAPELKPAPYFYYSDHSLEEDPDPLTPITASGHVPTFPAKMHAILTNPNLNDIVAWAPHGRSWTILKPRAFEVRILPKYFEHSKFSSFVRQANGWGFRRLSSGNDRPGFVAISEEFPVPDRPLMREILVLQRIMEKGAKARMPVNWELESPEVAKVMAAAAAAADIPSDLNLAEGANEEEDNGGGGGAEGGANNDGNLKPPALPEGGVSANVASMPHPQLQQLQQLAAMQQMNRAAAASLPQPPAPPTMNHGGDDSGFAAGFMAATAYHNRQVQSMLGSALMSGMPLDSFPTSQAATIPSSPSSMSRLQGLQGGNNFAAMMGAAAAAHRQSSSELAMTQQMQQMQASVAAASRPNVQNDFAMAQQLQLQAYQNFLNGRNAMPPPR
ncbi:heat shock factor family protein [Skeletonema marinoi]|uniref:Heat shock factor family protein n=1 Tax=Skeletonema marinoi TaxID=267567 RepID=A0AAD9DC17_9STRA|nr:heat shock factor family protein [Skeletonema marinoi]